MPKRRFFGYCIAFLLGFVFPEARSQSYECEEELFPRRDKQSRLYGYANAIGEMRVQPLFLKAFQFSGRYAIVQQGNRFGVINCEGVLVVPADYEEIASFSGGKGWVKRQGLWGLMDFRGRMLIAPQYEEVKEINRFSGTQTWVKKQGLWGLISKENGRVLLAPRYSDLSVISDSAAIGRTDGGQDLIYSGDGRVIIPGMKKVKKLNPSLYLFCSSDSRWGAFNSLAFLLIRPEWDQILANGPFLQVGREGRFGLRNWKGQEISPPKFQSIDPFIGGFAGAVENQKAYLLDSRAQSVLSDPLDRVEVVRQGRAIVSQNGKEGLYDPTRKQWLVPPSFSRIQCASDRSWLAFYQADGCRISSLESVSSQGVVWDSVRLKDPGNRIRVFQKGKVRVLPDPARSDGEAFDEVRLFPGGFFAGRSGSGWSLYREPGKAVGTAVFQEIISFQLPDRMVFAVRDQTGHWGLIEENGTVRLPFRFEGVLPAEGKLALVKEKGRWGLSDENGNLRVEARFDSVRPSSWNQEEARFPVLFFRKGKTSAYDARGQADWESEPGFWYAAAPGLWFCREGDATSLRDKKGKKLGELQLAEALPFSEGTAPVRMGEKWGFINASGRLVIPARFESVFPFRGGSAFAREGGKWGVLKRNGAWLVKPVGIGLETDEDGKRKLQIP